jgi:hypothetical protein
MKSSKEKVHCKPRECDDSVTVTQDLSLQSLFSPAFDHYDFLLPRDQIVGLLLDNSLDVEM